MATNHDIDKCLIAANRDKLICHMDVRMDSHLHHAILVMKCIGINAFVITA